MNAMSRTTLRKSTVLMMLFSALVVIFSLSVVAAQAPRAPQIGVSASELVFAGVINKTTIPTQPIVITNTGDQTLTISGITKSTQNTGAFTLSGQPAFPASVNPGSTVTVNVGFAPGSSQGRLTTNIVIDAANADDVTVPVYGLSTPGLEGSNEPTLDNVVKTLGYNINVGFTSLTSNTGTFPIGEEVLVPLFVKANTGSVTLRPVARYSPDRAIEFGYYFPNGSNPTRTEIATISAAISQSQQYPPNYQTLNPNIDNGGVLTFDPGSAQFGVFVEGLNDRLTYTQDSLNGSGPVDHAVRIYPLKDRAGNLVANSFLIGFEDAANGDYQDYMFVISNVRNPNAPTATNTPTSTPTNTSTNTSTSTPTDPPTLTPLTSTPLPPTEPTSTPSLPSTATETPVVATVTGTPPTPTLEPQRDIELLTNSSFEIDFNADSLPDVWEVKNLSHDKLKCDKPEAGKFFAHSGGCAFMFRPGPPENTKLVQKPDVAPINEASIGRLVLTAFTQAPVTPGLQFKVVISYVDPTVENDKFTVDIQASTEYLQFTQILATLVDPAVDKVKLTISNEIAQGKVFVDDVSLLWQTGPIETPAALPLP